MSNIVNQNNKVELTGTINGGLKLIYEHRGEKFYRAYIEVDRLSGTKDVLPLNISERLVDVGKQYNGCLVRVAGEYRSYNHRDSEKPRLILNVFVTEFEEITENSDVNINEIQLDGFICKKPVHRTTPLGKEIADTILAVNRTGSDISDYIPCIAWKWNADLLGSLKVGTRITINGRIQSRVYHKRLSETEVKECVAYEVSIGRMKVIN